ncbi:MAG: hypothetical protein AABX70_05065 [Nanoarchaeota archaeon]
MNRRDQRLEHIISKDPRLDQLVSNIYTVHDDALGGYYSSGMFNAFTHLGRVELCRDLIQKINELYQTRYEVPEPPRPRW